MYEMRPNVNTPVHTGSSLAELVCSNSLKSDLSDTASGLLKLEMRAVGSLVLEAAEYSRIPAGSALAVDKKLFSDFIEARLKSFSEFKLIREEIKNIDPSIPQIIAAGPLVSPALSDAICRLTGKSGLHFYDAVAPVIASDSIDMSKAFFASRYDKGDKDYINCPMSREEYDTFYKELVGAQRAELHEFDKGEIFEGCMPIEVMAARGYDSIRFGPLRPVGIRHPETGDKYFAVVQLRKENKSGTMYNIVVFRPTLHSVSRKEFFRLSRGLKTLNF
jgi:methylenetetrahydrofolate--tRNA-(uracil-5-)-methyltransferase